MDKRYIVKGTKIIDTDSHTEVCAASYYNDSNPLINAENVAAAQRFAEVIASALNHHNAREGGL